MPYTFDGLQDIKKTLAWGEIEIQGDGPVTADPGRHLPVWRAYDRATGRMVTALTLGALKQMAIYNARQRLKRLEELAVPEERRQYRT